MTSVKTEKKKYIKKIVNYGLLLLTASLIIVTLLVLVKINRGVAKTVVTPRHFIRLQVENASGDKKAIGEIEKLFESYQDNEIEIKIVERNMLDQRTINESFVVSRESDKTVSELFADKFGLSSDDIIHTPLENNYNHVSMTLVLGTDYENIINLLKSDKE